MTHNSHKWDIYVRGDSWLTNAPRSMMIDIVLLRSERVWRTRCRGEWVSLNVPSPPTRWELYRPYIYWPQQTRAFPTSDVKIVSFAQVLSYNLPVLPGIGRTPSSCVCKVPGYFWYDSNSQAYDCRNLIQKNFVFNFPSNSICDLSKVDSCCMCLSLCFSSNPAHFILVQLDFF